MAFGRPFRASVLAISVAAGSTCAHTETLGVVTQARRANLSTGPVSPGASLYDGDHVSTEVDGVLTLRSGTSTVFLGSQSRALLRSPIGKTAGAQVILSAGTVVFSTARAAALEVSADEVHIGPAMETRTLGQVTLAGPKSLYVYARRGSLKVSYRDESEIISEGKSYRMVLDPPDDNSAAKSGDGQPPPDGQRRRKPKGFLLLPLGAGTGPAATGAATGAATAAAAGAAAAAAAGAAIVPWVMPNDYESPDHP